MRIQSDSLEAHWESIDGSFIWKMITSLAIRISSSVNLHLFEPCDLIDKFNIVKGLVGISFDQFHHALG